MVRQGSFEKSEEAVSSHDSRVRQNSAIFVYLSHKVKKHIYLGKYSIK